MPTRYLLRVEGVNLGGVLDDTDDLSTRRGGGLMILNAVEQMAADTLDAAVRDRLTAVATGASVGLFTFDAASAADADQVRAAVAGHFRHQSFEYQDGDETGHLPLSRGTFVVDVVPVVGPEPGDDDRAAQLAAAANRWRQLREPTLSLDGLWDRADRACHLDRTRPAEPGRTVLKGKPDEHVSRSVYDRHMYGRTARQGFYARALDRPDEFAFTDTFAAISARGTLSDDIAPANTDNKLAVLYLDGNGFGRLGRERMRVAGADGFHDWSTRLQAHHDGLLRALLARTRNDPGWRNSDRVRLETLLWGGDEIVWVVPAWKGWELAAWFFSEPHEVGGERVTYAGSLVFCNTKAPITNVIGLAHRLVDDAKTGKNVHRLAYEVLESFDDIQGELADHRRTWLPPGWPVESLVLDAATLPKLVDDVRAVAACHDFPTRQLYMACKAWRRGEPFDRHVARLTDSPAKDALTAVRAAFGEPMVGYLHLLQMRPYVPAGCHA